MITGYGTSTGFEMYLQDQTGGDITDFYNIYLQYIYALNQRPEIQMAYSTFNINFRSIWWTSMRRRPSAGISPTEILSTLSGYYGGQYVSNINRFSKVYRVMIQADPKYRLDPESLNNVYVRMQNGEMAPISQFVKLTKVYGSEVLSRFNMYNSIAISGTVADGYSTGDAIKAIEEVAEQVLPKGYGYDFGGLTREESQTGSNTAIIFGICIILIYLILSALYELPDSFRRHSGRTVRSAGFVHSGQAHRTGEQHLPPDGSYHDYRSVVENRDSDYGVCGRPPQVGHESRKPPRPPKPVCVLF